MKRKAIFLATLMACGMAAEAQQKQSGAYANGSHNTVLGRNVIDTANLRIITDLESPLPASPKGKESLTGSKQAESNPLPLGGGWEGANDPLPFPWPRL